jgi:WXXGXW repeat (2 copies)
MRINRTIRTMLFALAVVTLSLVAFSPAASAQVRITVGFGPPAIPVYEQPICPGDGYLWTPGYWGWDGDDSDYYWVPGTWVSSPEVGFLWTPPWWGWDSGAYLFHDGYWGPQVGFYGGINYGFGFFGVGFVGGRWDGGHFFYNRDVANINVVNIHNVYNEHITINNNSHVSFNGGQGGIEARPTPQEEAAGRDRHVGAVAAQTQHIQAARENRDLRASVNQGRPSIAATSRPGDFHGGAVAAREAGGEYHAPANRAAAGAADTHPEAGGGHSAVHPNDLPAMEHPAAPNTGNTKTDQKYQKQQQKLYTQQTNERQKLQTQQDKEHAKLTQSHASDTQKQQVEQRHAQQTQQLQQRHTTQTQSLQSHQAPASRPR